MKPERLQKIDARISKLELLRVLERRGDRATAAHRVGKIAAVDVHLWQGDVRNEPKGILGARVIEEILHAKGADNGRLGGVGRPAAIGIRHEWHERGLAFHHVVEARGPPVLRAACRSLRWTSSDRLQTSRSGIVRTSHLHVR